MFLYQTPLRDMQFVLHELLGASASIAAMRRAVSWDRETTDQAIDAVGRFAGSELARLNAGGDEEGCRVEAGVVRTPRGFAEAYRRFVDAGWPTLAYDEKFGGQGAPAILYSAMLEMLYAANAGWTMYFGTARGAYECLHTHASPQQQAYYLPNVVSGRWTTTMCLTEAHCGSDLGLLRTRAVPQADGSYRINGSKLFISGGDQDFTENIVHLVLARVTGAPPGVRGISLFVVPKHLPQAGGLSPERNGMTATAVEHKMGLRGSATCAMNFEDSVGWLVGRPNEGMRNMFVMINSSRIGVAVQAVGLAQAAYCSALGYARERLQMRAAGGPRRPDLPADPIIEHADVRRMLLTQKAHVEAGRMLVYWLSLLLDQEAFGADETTRSEAAGLVGLLTPVAKAFLTENAFVAANHAIQIHGGHGYIRDHGVEQIVRDVRIAQIYEGTNGIQARDLLARKVLADGGAQLDAFLNRVWHDVADGGIAGLPGGFAEPLLRVCDDLRQLPARIGGAAAGNADEIGAAGTDFLRALGHVACAWLFARAAGVATLRLSAGTSDPLYASKLATARFYFSRLLPEASMHLHVARSGAASLSDLREDHLFV
ncbi:MAG: acyl-CoA dehydrogenase C-terminal domain-containing protein [Betaproteobacteria bacterium]|nr:acyl-CoA dehydrogenase C-terminal domain-containing protein [Betaproteobacteria bacterium]